MFISYFLRCGYLYGDWTFTGMTFFVSLHLIFSSGPTSCFNTLKREAVKRKDLAVLEQSKRFSLFASGGCFVIEMQYKSEFGPPLIIGGRSNPRRCSCLVFSFDCLHANLNFYTK